MSALFLFALAAKLEVALLLLQGTALAVVGAVLVFLLVGSVISLGGSGLLLCQRGQVGWLGSGFHSRSQSGKVGSERSGGDLVSSSQAHWLSGKIGRSPLLGPNKYSGSLGWALSGFFRGMGLVIGLGAELTGGSFLAGSAVGAVVTFWCVTFGLLHLADPMALVALVALDAGHPSGGLILSMMLVVGAGRHGAPWK
jgi:hypothetical protein